MRVHQVIEIPSDDQYGESRVFVVMAIDPVKGPIVREIFMHSEGPDVPLSSIDLKGVIVS